MIGLGGGVIVYNISNGHVLINIVYMLIDIVYKPQEDTDIYLLIDLLQQLCNGIILLQITRFILIIYPF